MIDIFDTEEFGERFLYGLLNRDESFVDENNKKKITRKQKIMDLYNAIFGNDYSTRKTYTYLGNCQFDAGSKDFVIRTASMLSKFADYDI